MGIAAGVGGMKGVLDSAPEISVEDVMPQGYKSFIYDRDGNLLTQLYQPETNRIQKDIGEIPKVLQNAFIALEDERFWEHNGIDPKGYRPCLLRRHHFRRFLRRRQYPHPAVVKAERFRRRR